MSDGTPAMWMRGGTSKGGYFLARDLPDDVQARDALLLRVMGSPDTRQIDGLGGADPLTSKVAVVRRSVRAGADVDYLFLQVFVDRAVVTDAQNCGNILAGVAPFAIERGLVPAADGHTVVRIFMENTQQRAAATVSTPGGFVTYEGTARIDGVPGTAAPVPLAFEDVAGSSCGALLPTGRVVDEIDSVRVTLIDNGMPCVIMRASDLGVDGTETPDVLDNNSGLRAQLERIRLAAGPMMNLGDVMQKTVPKMMLVSPPFNGGTISVRSFIPHRCHSSVGVFAAVSVAGACLVPGTPAAEVAAAGHGLVRDVSVEHPSGETTCRVRMDDAGGIAEVALLRTARKLFDGFVF